MGPFDGLMPNDKGQVYVRRPYAPQSSSTTGGAPPYAAVNWPPQTLLTARACLYCRASLPAGHSSYECDTCMEYRDHSGGE